MICLFAADCLVRKFRAKRSPAWMFVKCSGTNPGGLSSGTRRNTRLSKMLTGLGPADMRPRSVNGEAYV